jgi:type II secretory pathway component GspD/PulD (secretin)
MNQVARKLAGLRVSATLLLAGLALAFTTAPSASAQAPPSESQPPAQTQLTDSKGNPESIEILHLSSSTTQNSATDLLNAIRSVLGRAKIYYYAPEGALVVRGTAEDIEQARKIVSELDKPQETFRLTYSITQIEDGKRAGTERFTLIATSGQRSDLKQGSRIPIMTGKLDADAATPAVQMQYLDVGLNISATINGSNLLSKVEQSAIADEKSNVGIQDPVLRQTVLEGVAAVTPGKPLVLGSLDLPGTTHRQEVEVLVERLP